MFKKVNGTHITFYSFSSYLFKKTTSKAGVGNFFSQRARFNENKLLRARLKEKKSFAGHSIFENFTLK